MIALPLSALSTELQTNLSSRPGYIYIDTYGVGYVASDTGTVFVWNIRADLDDAAACNLEFQAELAELVKIPT